MNRLALSIAVALPLLACTSKVDTVGADGDAGTTIATTTDSAGGGGQGGAGQGGAAQGGAGGAHTGVGGAGGSVVTVPCACPGELLEWGLLGGYVQWNDRTVVKDCEQLTLTRDMLLGYPQDEPNRVCIAKVAPCGAASPIAVDGLANAFGQPDVQAALELSKTAESEPLFGRDDRPTDGQVFQMKLGTASFLVGGPCHEDDTPATCTPVPLGIAAAVTTLQGLDEALRAEDTCKAALADPPK